MINCFYFEHFLIQAFKQGKAKDHFIALIIMILRNSIWIEFLVCCPRLFSILSLEKTLKYKK